jgi:hypothetical protein
VTVAVEPKDEAVRVQQQLHYKVRLYSKHPIVDGVLSDPQPVDAVVEQLGEDRKGSARVGGQTFEVIERDYAIFPEKSGALEIPPVTFRGHVSDPNRQRSMNDPFQRMDSMMNGFFREPFLDQFFQRSPLAGSLFARGGTKVRVHSEATSVTVEPRPAGYGGSFWLPAEEVVLHDSWADGVPTLRAGEPLTRTITLEAKGAAASQLPELVVPAVKGLRVYPERSERDNVTDGQRVHGRLAQSFTFMPTEEGDVTLPEIRLSWWDTNANVERVAILPEIATHVLPGTGATYNPAVGDAPPTGAETRPNETAPVPALNVAPRWYDSLSIWVSGLLVVALLAAVLAWWRNHMRRGDSAHESAPDRPTLDGNTARARLEQACRSNNAYAAATALLTWATATWPQRPPQNLTELASRVAAGGEAIEMLNRALYAPDSDKWAGTALWEALRGGLREHNESKAAKQKGLPPLYPQAV